MDLNELKSFKLADAVKFHTDLNPKLWKNDQLDPLVKKQLLLIAEDFVEELGINGLDVVDVTVSGSNAAYSYTPHSDLDLHILVDMSKLPNDEVYRELFNAKKTIYNDSHDITVHGVPVELYVQDSAQPVVSLGEYSIVHDKWIKVPKRKRANFDQNATKAKYEQLSRLIQLALKSKDVDKINKAIKTIKRYRQAGLDKGGEFGPENLAYKALRSQGAIQELYDTRDALHSEKLSIEEEHNLLNKPTPTIADLAEKHGTERRKIAQQLDKGIKIELEHTKDRSVAREIALDHLGEDPKYYDKLARVELDETVEENQIVNVVSRIAADKIVKIMLKNEGKIMSFLQAGMTPKTHLTLFGLKPKDLNVPNVKDPLLNELLKTMQIKVTTTKDWTNDNDVKVYGSYFPGDNDIELNFPAHEFSTETRGSTLQAEIANTLAHEIQHAIDDLKSQGTALKDPSSFKGLKKDYQGYLKLPYEVNARFQQATMDLATYIAMPKKDGSKTTQADLPELIRYAFQKNRLDKIYEKNQPEYKRLLSRAYKFFQAELNAPKKATPQNIVKRAVNWIMGNPTKEINEASGYIPSEKEKNDLRFKTALTVDVKPDSIKKNAKAFNWKTSRAGIPPQANPNGKIAEDLMREFKTFLAEEEQQELFPGYDEQHRQQRLDNWLQNTHAWDGHKPMVFYHATTKDFDTFNTHGTGFASALGMAFEVERHGSFFAVDPKFAETFIEDPNTREYKEGGRVIPVYLSVQNPIDLRDNSLSRMLSDEETVEGFKANDIDLWSIYQHVYEDQRWELFDGPEGGEFVENLQKLGFDGAIINEAIPNDSNARSGEVWVVFNPNQVKSVRNRGSFSPDDPRLMKENG